MRQTSGHDMEAARWALALQNPDSDPQEIGQAIEWLNKSPQNQLAFERVQRFLDACDNIAGDPALQPSEQRLKPLGRVFGRQPLALAASLGMLLAVIGVVGAIVGWQQREPNVSQSQQFASRAGELKSVVLADNSTILLSGASAVWVTFRDKERRIDLVRGEALFEVASDRHRPFVVQSGRGTATALGTQFNVHREGDGATVTVVHGRVAVNSTGSEGNLNAVLGPATQVKYDGGGAMSPVRRVDLDTVLAWRTGTLIFTDRPLFRVIAEVNRYSSEPIQIRDPAIGFVQVTGSVKVDRIPEWLQGLEKVMGLSVERTEEGLLLERKSGGETQPSD